jgi:phosphoribosylaminoimidazole-succinocarboxamide synthase
MGKEGQVVPEMSDEWVKTISERYIELYEKVTGNSFVPVQMDPGIIQKKVTEALKKLK